MYYFCHFFYQKHTLGKMDLIWILNQWEHWKCAGRVGNAAVVFASFRKLDRMSKLTSVGKPKKKGKSKFLPEWNSEWSVKIISLRGIDPESNRNFLPTRWIVTGTERKRFRFFLRSDYLKSWNTVCEIETHIKYRSKNRKNQYFCRSEIQSGVK